VSPLRDTPAARHSEPIRRGRHLIGERVGRSRASDPRSTGARNGDREDRRSRDRAGLRGPGRSAGDPDHSPGRVLRL